MAFCTNCGTQIPDNVANCPACGAAVETKAQADNGNNKQIDLSEKVSGFTNTPDITASIDPNDIQNNKLMAILAYIGILVLIPILAAKESRFARFHANQGLVLMIASFALSIVGTILGLIPILGAIIALATSLLSFVIFILSIIGIYNAATGKAKQLPLIGGITLIK